MGGNNKHKLNILACRIINQISNVLMHVTFSDHRVSYVHSVAHYAKSPTKNPTKNPSKKSAKNQSLEVPNIKIFCMIASPVWHVIAV